MRAFVAKVVSAERYPRLAAYLGGLPDGLDSYPDCLSRTSLAMQLIEGIPEPRPRPEEVPEPLSGLLHRRPPRLWMPEVHVMALSVAIADHYQMDDAAYLRWEQDVNRGYFRNLVLRFLFAFVSPAELAVRAPSRWSSVHTGSALSTRGVSDREHHIILDYPEGLYAPVHLEHFCAVFQALLEHSNAKDCAVSLVEQSPTRAVFAARWS